MKRKTIVVNIMSILLCVCAVVVGVFCTQIVTLNMSGSISYEVLLPLFYDETYGWHIKMGKVSSTLANATYASGTQYTLTENTQLIWVPVIEVAEDGTETAFDCKTIKPVAGHTYYFLSYNILPVVYGSTKCDEISFNFFEYISAYESSYYSWYLDDSGNSQYHKDGDNNINATDYSVSNIRAYLNGNTAYQNSTTPNYTADTSKQLTNFLDLYCLNNDPVYISKITPRTLEDLYKASNSSSSSVEPTVPNVTEPYESNSETSDKLWLFSYGDWTTCYTNGNDVTKTFMSASPIGSSSNTFWWVYRYNSSATSREQPVVFSSGTINGQAGVINSFGLRPAFKIVV